VKEKRSARVRRLYGRRFLPSSHRKAMLVLATRPAPMSSSQLARAGHTQGYAGVQRALWKMESQAWVKPSRAEDGRRCYAVTAYGYRMIMELLGLPPYA
jgi:hypothetical protein